MQHYWVTTDILLCKVCMNKSNTDRLIITFLLSAEKTLVKTKNEPFRTNKLWDFMHLCIKSSSVCSYNETKSFPILK